MNNKVKEMWITSSGDIVAKTEDGYYLGVTTNFFFFEKISQEKAEKLLKESQ
ncbi:MAG: hypothetical protein PHO23_00755 [Candidatus Pacebacteria bacterium]|nr:hypothetical protein [Candidatus Paceibacterota bacterium]